MATYFKKTKYTAKGDFSPSCLFQPSKEDYCFKGVKR